MADNRSDDYRRNDRADIDMIGRANNYSNNYSEKNVTEMNTQDKDIEMRRFIDCSDSIMTEDDRQMDALLDELLGEIAREDAKMTAPLEAQAAWRRAVRAEADAQNEKVQRRGAKIVPLSRWMKSAGSIAAALVVLFAGTYAARLDEDIDKKLPETAPIYDAYEEQNEYGYRTFRDERGVVISPNGYALNTTLLKSDGKDDQPQTSTTTGTGVGNQTANETEAMQNDAISAPIVVRSAERSIQSMNYDSDMQWMSDLVSEYDAYYEEKTENAAADAQSGRMSTMVIRVPAERLDDFLMEMNQLGVTVMRSEKAEEITGKYMDAQSRLSAMYLQKEKLGGMIDKAQNVQEVIAIDAQLSEVLSEIERLEGDMRRWQSQQSYCTVKVTIEEVFEQPLAAEASMGERMKAGFDESVAWLGEFGRDALVVLVAFLPRLAVFVPAAVLLWIVIAALVRRKNK